MESVGVAGVADGAEAELGRDSDKRSLWTTGLEIIPKD
jgi:hypothetical protein